MQIFWLFMRQPHVAGTSVDTFGNSIEIIYEKVKNILEKINWINIERISLNHG